MNISKLLIIFLLIPFPVWATNYTQDANCQGAWLMELDEDPLTDSSQNTNTAALAAAGSPDYQTASPPAAYSVGYYYFDALDDSCRVTNHASLNPGGDFSIVGWINMDSYGVDDLGRIVHKLEFTGLDFAGYAFFVADGVAGFSVDSMGLTIGAAFTSTTINSNASVIDIGSWYHVAAVFDDTANTVTFYSNGASAGGDTCNLTPLNNTRSFFIGYDATSWRFDGDIDELAFFDRTLDSTEINAIMDNGLAAEEVAVTGTTLYNATLYNATIN